MDALTLASGHKMPIHGFGVSRISSEQVAAALNAALDAGYRLIDCAAAYRNEEAVGEALKTRFQRGMSLREELFITSKPSEDEDPVPYHTGVQAYDHMEAWKVLEQLVDEGKVKAIGLSNFNSEQIERVHASAHIPISNLQVECHLYLQQRELFHFCHERNITLTGYAPLGSPAKIEARGTHPPGPLYDSLVVRLSEKYRKSPAQILLKFNIQRGICVISKSVHQQRIKENVDMFDFTLSKEDMQSLLNVRTKHRFFPLETIPHMKEHPDFPYNIPY